MITKVDPARWQQAQESERRFAAAIMNAGDDWNHWWAEKFHWYVPIWKKHYPNVLEVGCGIHTNLRYILPRITCDHIYMEDPLIQMYLGYGITNRIRLLRLNYLQDLCTGSTSVDFSSDPLETLPYSDGLMNLVICINVMDHVQDYEKCMAEIHRVLCPGGTLVFGQDLTDESDYKTCPETLTDTGHPIKLDLRTVSESLDGNYEPIYEHILPREEGRNPRCHYATYLGTLTKKGEPCAI